LAATRKILERVDDGELLRQANYGDDSERREAYKGERGQRWSLEEKLREPVAEMVCRLLENHFQTKFTYGLYADEIIAARKEAYPDDPLPGFVVGAPDFQIDGRALTWYVELKIKKKRFQNTLNGSKSIPKYGCRSHYLDENPVFNNIIEHAKHFKIHASKIIILYAVHESADTDMETPLDSTAWELEGIDFKSLAKNVLDGRYVKYAGGYGQPAFLVRCDDLKGLFELFQA
jgi:hypothetical protein